MPFIDIDNVPALTVLPGCRLRTPYGQNLMLSYLEMDSGAEVPLHHHPHEQAGMLLKGRMQLTIGDETRMVEAGSMFIIPPNTPHEFVCTEDTIDIDFFAPQRQDWIDGAPSAAAKISR